MRYVIAVVMLAMGCAPGPAGPQGPVGPRGEPGEGVDVSALVAEVAALRAEVKAARVKVPHLIVKETGEDLGVFVGFDLAWSDALGAYYKITGPASVYYSQRRCTGQAWTSAAEGYAVASTGRIVFVTDKPAPVIASSRVGGTGNCLDEDTPFQEMASTFTDTGIAGRAISPRETAIELR